MASSDPRAPGPGDGNEDPGQTHTNPYNPDYKPVFTHMDTQFITQWVNLNNNDASKNPKLLKAALSVLQGKSDEQRHTHIYVLTIAHTWKLAIEVFRTTCAGKPVMPGDALFEQFAPSVSVYKAVGPDLD